MIGSNLDIPPPRISAFKTDCQIAEASNEAFSLRLGTP
jgi:hypothetical protein